MPGIQLAHAGRKASCDKPWNGGKPLAREAGGWETLGPSEAAFGDYPPPRAMKLSELEACAADFRLAAFMQALEQLQVVKASRTERVLTTLSDPTAAPISEATTKAACGAWPGTK